MQSCSNEFLVKISKPKMSRRPMKVSLPALALFLAGRFDSSCFGPSVLIEIEALIFYTIQLKMLPYRCLARESRAWKA